LALLLAACLMLEHVGYKERADQVRAVTESVLREDRVRTRSQRKSDYAKFTQAITRRLSADPGSS
jgi:isocitrate/isopropylmalate dehydrogenase